MNNKTKEIYTLFRVNGVGPAAIRKITDAGYNTIHELASECNEEELKKYIRGKNQASAINEILNNAERHAENIEMEIEGLQSLEIVLYSKWDDKYPMGYKLIKDPPLFIYTKGNSELLNWQDSIAVIGTRECSETGENIAKRAAQYFAEKNFNIVSGLAKGIDTAAHEGALNATEGKTTAVLVDIKTIFPEENTDLAERILNNNGLLIAENPPGTPPAGNLFVRRDRLQSGLSLAVFPIETDIEGGTMHTVRFAGEQNRLVFVPDLKVIPDYDIYNSKATGILHLSESDGVGIFTKELYSEILEKLETKKSELYKIKNNQGDPITGQTENIF